MTADLTLLEGGAAGAVGLRNDGAADDAEHTTRQIERRLRQVVEIRYNADFDAIVAVEVRDGISDDRLQHAFEFVGRLLEAAPIALIIAELTRLRKVTAARGQDERDLHAIFRLYAEALAGYPADVIRHACRRGHHKWWPALEELREQCEMLVADRRRIAEGLRRGTQTRIAVAPWTPGSDDDKRYVDEMIARTRGAVAAVTAQGAGRPRRPELAAPTPEDEAELAARKAQVIADLAADSS
jgi:hypothetical protein